MPKEYLLETTPITEPQPISGTLIYDNHTAGLRYVGTGTGADFVCEIDENPTYFPGSALHIKTRATAPAEDDTVEATKNFAIMGKGTLSLSCVFQIPTIGYAKHFYILLAFTHSTNVYAAGILVDRVNSKLQYIDFEGNAQDVTGGSLTLGNDFPCAITFSVDFDNLEYLSLTVAGQTYNLSGIAIYDQDDAQYHAGYVQFQLQAASADRPDLYIDHFLLTQTP